MLKYPTRARKGPVNTAKVGKILGPSAPTQTDYITVTDAADRLGVKPWDVMRLVETGVVQSLVLIDAASLEAVKEKS